jgi:hypothetical protein
MNMGCSGNEFYNNTNVHKNAYCGGIKKGIGRSDLKQTQFCQILIDLIAQI